MIPTRGPKSESSVPTFVFWVCDDRLIYMSTVLLNKLQKVYKPMRERTFIHNTLSLCGRHWVTQWSLVSLLNTTMVVSYSLELRHTRNDLALLFPSD